MKRIDKLTNFCLIPVLAAGLFSVPIEVGAHGGEHHGEPHGEMRTVKKKAEKSPVVSLRGEVLDLSCYLGHGAKGKKHKKCAKACLVKKHVSAGLLTEDGSVLLLVMDHKHEKAFRGIGELAAENVVVTGTRAKKGGLNAILVHSVKKIK